MPYANRAEIGLRSEILRLIESDVANYEIGAALLAWGCSVTFATGGRVALVDALAERMRAAARMSENDNSDAYSGWRWNSWVSHLAADLTRPQPPIRRLVIVVGTLPVHTRLWSARKSMPARPTFGSPPPLNASVNAAARLRPLVARPRRVCHRPIVPRLPRCTGVHGTTAGRALDPVPLRDGRAMLGEEVLDDPAHDDVREFLEGLPRIDLAKLPVFGEDDARLAKRRRGSRRSRCGSATRPTGKRHPST